MRNISQSNLKCPKRPKLVSGFVVGLAALALSGCGLHSLHVQQSPLLKYFAPKSGRLAYLGVDGNIHIGDQGGHVIDVTKDGQVGSSATLSYGSPTWSSDGKQIVFTRFKVDSSANTQTATVLTANSEGKDLRTVFSSTSLAPFYFYWSPDDKEIGMLSQSLDSQSQGNIEMGIIPLTAKDPSAAYRVINSDAPFYWVWGPAGKEIIAHTQSGSAQDAPDYVRILPTAGRGGNVDQLKASLGAFDTPAIAADGKDVVIPIGSADASDLVVRNLTSGSQRMVAKALGSVSYDLSPDGKWLAFIDQANSKSSSSRVLHIVEVNNPKNSFTVKERPVFSFYWAPNSKEIAYVVPLQSKASIDSMFAHSNKLPYAQLQVVDVSKRDSWAVSQFPVTQGFLNSVPFNDQYQHSSTIWSPNSKYIVFSAYTAQGNPGVFVAGADGNIKPDLVGSGEFPTWSWH